MPSGDNVSNQINSSLEEARNLERVYDPAQVENKWYAYWKEREFFKPNPAQVDKPAYSIVMPPPNVTGSLHLGHALDNTLQDILIRWRRMQGYSCLWLPGTDHAGIATQARVEEALAEEGLSRHDLGRGKFLERVWEWKNTYGDKIISQLSLMGSSCDWSRTRFTMDEGCSKAVREVFVNLYQKGLIYQGDYIINWCPKCHTALSDIEVEHEDQAGNLWYIKYPVEGGDEYLVVATTRPETMLGDTGVAVNPEDERYRNLIGKMARLPLMDRLIPIFADEYVDPEFGTGAVKVTPAHDPNDFEMGLRHELPQITVMDTSGYMNENAGAYEGLERQSCRRQIVRDLDKSGLLVRTEDHDHAVGHCQRCNTIVEPLISKQWFVKMKPLAEPALQAVKDGDIRFVPERFTKIYTAWMENIRDWCISRQLWWGHRIPVWYCQDCRQVICSKTDPEKCPICNGTQLLQDEDVLDTWFSSALWPFSTLGWPEDTEDLQTFYPTSVLVTGRDIIFFWVARMIFSGLAHTGKVPFFDVNIHGLILDAQGRKMSKSLGNGIDPLEVITKFGADTLRFSMITGVTPGNDIRFNWEKVENTRNFANKLWNAARFVLMNLEGYSFMDINEAPLELVDKWLLTRLQQRKKEIDQHLESYELGEAARILYDFIWDDFCDWYIELAKPRLGKASDALERKLAQNVLCHGLMEILHLLHPFMPFITEEIYQKMPGAKETIMLQTWPAAEEALIKSEEAEQMQELMTLIRAIRNIRGEYNINPGAKIRALFVAGEQKFMDLLLSNQTYVLTMAGVSHLETVTELDTPPAQAACTQFANGVLYVPFEDVIDVDKEINRLQKELVKAEKEIEQSSGKLNNDNFIAKAPQEVAEKEKNKLTEAKNKKEGIWRQLQRLKK